MASGYVVAVILEAAGLIGLVIALLRIQTVSYTHLTLPTKA